MDPFLPWKRTEKVLKEASRRGFETVVAMDDRTSAEDRERLEELADIVVPWKSEGFCEKAYKYVAFCKGPYVLLISDDEEPSDMLWRIAHEPPVDGRFGVPVIPLLNGKVWQRDVGIQERLFPKEGWRWTGGFEGTSESPYRKMLISRNPGAVVWHFYLEAPREEREAKARRYEALDPSPVHRERLIWEDHPEDLVAPPEPIKHLITA